MSFLLRKRKRGLSSKLFTDTNARVFNPRKSLDDVLSDSSSKLKFKSLKPSSLINIPNSDMQNEPITTEPTSRYVERYLQSENQSYGSESHQFPSENPFFELSSPRKITDEQLYQEFKTDYITQRAKLALQKCRRFQLPLKRTGTVDTVEKGMRLRKFPKKIGCRFEA
jgi:hypothetical protein